MGSHYDCIHTQVPALMGFQWEDYGLGMNPKGSIGYI